MVGGYCSPKWAITQMGIVHQYGLSLQWGLFPSVHQYGLSLQWGLFPNVVYHPNGDCSPIWSITPAGTVPQCGLSPQWGLFTNMVYHPSRDCSPMWSITRLVSHEGGQSPGVPAYTKTGSLAPTYWSAAGRQCQRGCGEQTVPAQWSPHAPGSPASLGINVQRSTHDKGLSQTAPPTSPRPASANPCWNIIKKTGVGILLPPHPPIHPPLKKRERKNIQDS